MSDKSKIKKLDGFKDVAIKYSFKKNERDVENPIDISNTEATIPSILHLHSLTLQAVKDNDPQESMLYISIEPNDHSGDLNVLKGSKITFNLKYETNKKWILSAKYNNPTFKACPEMINIEIGPK